MTALHYIHKQNRQRTEHVAGSGTTSAILIIKSAGLLQEYKTKHKLIKIQKFSSIFIDLIIYLFIFYFFLGTFTSPHDLSSFSFPPPFLFSVVTVFSDNLISHPPSSPFLSFFSIHQMWLSSSSAILLRALFIGSSARCGESFRKCFVVYMPPSPHSKVLCIHVCLCVVCVYVYVNCRMCYVCIMCM